MFRHFRWFVFIANKRKIRRERLANYQFRFRLSRRKKNCSFRWNWKIVLSTTTNRKLPIRAKTNKFHHHHQQQLQNFVRFVKHIPIVFSFFWEFRQPLQKENKQKFFHQPKTKNSKHPEKISTRTRPFRFIEYKNDIAR